MNKAYRISPSCINLVPKKGGRRRGLKREGGGLITFYQETYSLLLSSHEKRGSLLEREGLLKRGLLEDLWYVYIVVQHRFVIFI